MDRIGYAAVNVGDRELALGYDEFMSRAKGVSYPFISANIVRRDTQEPVFPPYAIVQATSPDGKARLKVGVLGATRYNPLFLKAGPGNSNLVIVKPEEVLPRYIDEVRAKSDVVILLAALHKEEAKRIVRRVPGIRFVVAAYGGIITAREEKEAGAWLLYAGNQGKRVGETRVFLGGDHEVLAAETYMHLLTARYPHDQKMLDFVNRVAAEVQKTKTQAQAATTAGSQASK